MTDHQPEKIELEGWHFRVQYPRQHAQKTRVMLLFHGYEGNENVMWVLTRPLPDNYLLIALRAPIQHSENQYVWHEIASQWPNIDVYRQFSDQLLITIDHWLQKQDIHSDKYDLMGFSQGAVVAYALAFLKPDRINRVAALAGFIPYVWQAQIDGSVVKNKHFFIAHGTKDEIIPLIKAQQAAAFLKKNNAQITFCEAEIGHKLSSNCFPGLGAFFT